MLITFLKRFFRVWLYKLKTPEFNEVKRSQYGIGAVFIKEIVEYIGNNCFIPTSTECFMKCIKNLTGRD